MYKIIALWYGGETTMFTTFWILCSYYLCLSGGFSGSHLFCLLFYVQDYCKSNQLISLKLDGMTKPTDRKKLLTFGGDPVPELDSRLLFHFPSRCGIEDFRIIICIFRTVTGWFSRHLAKYLTTISWWIRNILEVIRQTFRSEFGNPDSNARSLLVEVRYLGVGLHSLSTV